MSLDYSQPVSSLLRLGTYNTHQSLENAPGARWLVRGELDQDEYIRFLMMLWSVYTTLESALSDHASNPVLAPSYSPALFSRAPAIAADISYYLATPASQWQAHPMYQQLAAAPPEPLTVYTSRLTALAASDPELLLAHAYVRYLGDLSGGQTMKRNLSKSYDLDSADGLGVQLYTFTRPGSSATTVGSVGEIKRIKEWYRDSMDRGVGDDEKLKTAILEEAETAYAPNAGIFAILRAPTDSNHGATHSKPMVGDSSTPVSASMWPRWSLAGIRTMIYFGIFSSA